MAIEDLYGKILALGVQTIRRQTNLAQLVNHETAGDRTQGSSRGGITEVIVPPEFTTRDITPAAVPPASAAAPSPTTVQVPLDFWKEVNFPLTEKHITLLENADTAAPMFLDNAVGPIAEAITAACDASNIEVADVDWFVPHQANQRIIKGVGDRLGLDVNKVISTVAMHANTSAASIPLALDAAIQDGRIKRGDLVLLEAMGGGLTWGACAFRL